MSERAKITEHLRRIKEKEYLIPNFQREFIWKQNRILKLLRSILDNKPIGGMLIWKSKVPLTSKRFDSTTKDDYKLYILDGQQRLTALYIIMYGELPYYYTKEEVEKTIKSFQIVIDISNAPEYKLIFQSKIDDSSTQMKISDLLRDNYDFDNMDGSKLKFYNSLRRNFTDKDIFYEQFEGDNVKEAIDIFHDINTAGVKLTGAELLLAYISGYWYEAREEIKKIQLRLRNQNFDFKIDIFTQFILACIVITNNSTDKTLHNKNKREEVLKCWEKLTNNDGAISKTIAFLKKYKVLKSNEIANKPSIIPIVFCHYHFDLNEAEEKKLASYFFYTQAFIYFRTNVNTRMTEHLKTIYLAKQESIPLCNQLQSCIEGVTKGQKINEELLKVNSDKSSLFFMMKWTFRNNNAVCLDEKQSIDLESVDFPFDKDHIFSRAFLKNKYNTAEDKKAINEIANLCFLKSKANKIKSNKSASDFLKYCKDKNPEALRKQCIPEEENLWHIDKFKDFLKARRSLIAYDINQYIDSLGDKNLSEYKKAKHISIDEIIDDIISDEDEDTEFKSSLRWNYDKNEKDTSLEKSIIKTIAGFSNHIGGNLYIGVGDNNELLGIQKDCDTFDGTQDKFRNHLVQIILKNFGETFLSNYININFFTINNEDLLDKLDDEKKDILKEKLLYEDEEAHSKLICLVAVEQSKELKFIVEKNKNGIETKKCYVRQDGRTAILPADEIIKYNEERQ